MILTKEQKQAKIKEFFGFRDLVDINNKIYVVKLETQKMIDKEMFEATDDPVVFIRGIINKMYREIDDHEKTVIDFLNSLDDVSIA